MYYSYTDKYFKQQKLPVKAVHSYAIGQRPLAIQLPSCRHLTVSHFHNRDNLNIIVLIQTMIAPRMILLLDKGR